MQAHVYATPNAQRAVDLILGGTTPRHFALDPTAQWLLCGNQDFTNVTVFRRFTPHS
jgi:6-phosphogluconolactonase (cycloisomerase 2 family)